MSDYTQRLPASDLQTDCAEEIMHGSRVPTLGLPGFDEVDSAPPMTHSAKHMQFEKHGQSVDTYDSGLGSMRSECSSLSSITDQMKDIAIVSRPTAIAEENKGESGSFEDEDSGVCSMNLTEEQRKKLEIAEQIYNPDEDGDTKLHLAIIQKSAELIDQCIYFCPDPHWLTIQNLLQQSPLHLAVLTDQPEVVRKLLVFGSGLEMRDRHGNTALHLASKLGLGPCVEALTFPITEAERQFVPISHRLAHRMPQDMSIKNYDGETCLHLAAAIGHTNLLHFLVNSCHADINSQEGKSGRTILHQAVESNNTGLVSFLLQHPGADKEALTYDLSTPLQLAWGRRHSSVMAMLIQSGADRSRIREDDSASDSDDEMELDNCVSSQYITSMVR